ncbi:MAG TPA: hypothetical protein VM912_07770 [Terriglobales bacterium]|nr:hypothetical protein [Terriglobales bacterium]
MADVDFLDEAIEIREQSGYDLLMSCTEFGTSMAKIASGVYRLLDGSHKRQGLRRQRRARVFYRLGERSFAKPSVKVFLECNDRAARGTARTTDGERKVALVALDRPNTPAQILRNLFPGIEYVRRTLRWTRHLRSTCGEGAAVQGLLYHYSSSVGCIIPEAAFP